MWATIYKSGVSEYQWILKQLKLIKKIFHHTKLITNVHNPIMLKNLLGF
jgi:hypothetical protein